MSDFGAVDAAPKSDMIQRVEPSHSFAGFRQMSDEEKLTNGIKKLVFAQVGKGPRHKRNRDIECSKAGHITKI